VAGTRRTDRELTVRPPCQAAIGDVRIQIVGIVVIGIAGTLLPSSTVPPTQWDLAYAAFVLALLTVLWLSLGSRVQRHGGGVGDVSSATWRVLPVLVSAQTLVQLVAGWLGIGHPLVDPRMVALTGPLFSWLVYAVSLVIGLFVGSVVFTLIGPLRSAAV
jgi:hypothetical protein